MGWGGTVALSPVSLFRIGSQVHPDFSTLLIVVANVPLAPLTHLST
ncbi:MAG: hypothetical protein JTT11_00380 [Candidatus Brockarchaeota archaeon]|nr:hypothetical protein [Candidatus Brockarchaeota archaeon]